MPEIMIDPGDPLTVQNGMPFSTYDRDNDKYLFFACSTSHYGGSGWWFNRCGFTCPTSMAEDQYKWQTGHPLVNVRMMIKIT